MDDMSELPVATLRSMRETIVAAGDQPCMASRDLVDLLHGRRHLTLAEASLLLRRAHQLWSAEPRQCLMVVARGETDALDLAPGDTSHLVASDLSLATLDEVVGAGATIYLFNHAYLLQADDDWEQYRRRVGHVDTPLGPVAVTWRSARSPEARAGGWGFSNALLLTIPHDAPVVLSR